MISSSHSWSCQKYHKVMKIKKKKVKLKKFLKKMNKMLQKQQLMIEDFSWKIFPIRSHMMSFKDYLASMVKQLTLKFHFANVVEEYLLALVLSDMKHQKPLSQPLQSLTKRISKAESYISNLLRKRRSSLKRKSHSNMNNKNHLPSKKKNQSNQSTNKKKKRY